VVFRTKSTIGTHVTPEEGTRFYAAAARFLEEEKPDVVISYGSSAYTRELQAMARKKCRRFVIYVANAAFNDPKMFAPSDTVVCPSRFLADFYRNKFGLDPVVIPSIIKKGQYVADTHRISAHTASRRTGVLLVPSFCEEAAGRVIVEARMNGIPVLAANRGGIPEQLDGQGFLFDIPKQCLNHFGAVPEDRDVQPWLDTLCRLMDDDTAYTAAAVPAGGQEFSSLAVLL
jgi:glycosyltransferase involved in cell wall biosynthesis